MKVNQIITQRIIDELEQGRVPWHKTWKDVGLPKNLVSKKAYQGINVLMLSMAPYPSPWFVTYKQAKDLGGCVKKGEHGWMVVWWKTLEYPDLDPESDHLTRTIPYIRYYTVFNVTQCEGLEGKIPENKAVSEPLNTIDSCEKIILGYKDRPPIINNGRAVYYPTKDEIGIPPLNLFESSEAYYSALFHECVHSTGHVKRLDRKTISDCSPFGSENYSKEELVAEIGSVFLYNLVGISNTFKNSVNYIGHWIDKLKADPNLIISAAGQAQKAFNHILDIAPTYNGEAANEG